MKKITSLKLAVAVMAIACFTIVLKSCKKVDNNTANPKDASAALAAVQKAIIAKYGNVSAGVVIPVNKSADEYFYKDATGNNVNLYGQSPSGTNGPSGGGGCQYNCSNTINPAQLVITYTLNSLKRFYMCEGNANKSTVTVTWTVSAPFTVTSMMAGNIISVGYLKFTPAAGTPTVLSTYFPNLTVTNMGAAPGCSTNTLYQVEYTITQVPNSYFTNGNIVSAAVDLANDCKLVNNMVSSGYVNVPIPYQSTSLPCNRVDAVFFNPATPGSPAFVTGLYTISCAPPSGMTGATHHQLEYRKVTTTNGDYSWSSQVSNVFWGNDPITGSLQPALPTYNGVLNLNSMTLGTGKWLIRYRNVYTGTCDVIYLQPGNLPNGYWGNSALWNVEMWDMF